MLVKGMKRSAMIGITILLVAAASGFSLAGIQAMSGTETQAGIRPDLDMTLVTSDYATHAPIVITSDADFASQGWPGNGTAGNPYEIEGLEILGENGPCIIVYNTVAHFVVENCFLRAGHYGIEMYRLSNATIRNNVIFQFIQNGIYLDGAGNNTIEENVIYNEALSAEGAVFVLDNYKTGQSRNNIIRDNLCRVEYGYAIKLLYSHNASIIGNNCSSNEHGTGIYLIGSENATISDNICNNNMNGMSIGPYSTGGIVRNFLVLNNTCLNNQQTGLYINAGTDLQVRYCLIVNNTLGWNGGVNAQDWGLANQWDDGRFGNLYGDYIGVGSYMIDGSADSIDHYPRKADTTMPVVDGPDDSTYELGSGGNWIVWAASDEHPETYRVLKNGAVVKSDTWYGNGITVLVDGLGLGVFNFTLSVYDTCANSATDVVLVAVEDTTPPELDSPADISFEIGETGRAIVWHPYDLLPSSYEILQNGTVVASGSWDGSDIEISVDGLAQGSYNYTLVVSDLSNNIASDTVFIRVLPNVTTSATTTDNVTNDLQWIPPLVTGTVIGGVACTIIVLIITRRRAK